MSEGYDFDVAVVGAGPAGYVAGIRAAQLGARACVIEKGPLGGCCTNVGCIPTKALWHAAGLALQAGRADEFGFGYSGFEFDYGAIARRRDEVVKRLRGGVRALLKAKGVELAEGAAAFADPHTLTVVSDGGDRRVRAERIVVATGSRAVELPAAPFDHELIICSDDAVTAEELPESVLIIGGGYIGVEFATIYNAFGVEVTIVEMLERLLPGMDADCAAEITRALRKRGVEVVTGVALDEVARQENAVRGRLSDGRECAAQKMLVCVGRRADCEGLAIENAGLSAGEKGQLAVNEHMQTQVPHIYAAGDVTGRVLLAHVGSHQATVAAAHATGSITAAMHYRVVPACVFAIPEIATVGMTEDEAAGAGVETTVKKFPFRALGKAHIMGETDGFVKMVADAGSGELLGVQICGADASALLGEAALALKLECTAEELADTIHAHPTLAESVREAAEGVTGLAVNWRG